MLRLAGSAILLLFLAMLFVILWRDVRGAAVAIEASRRTYGRLIVLQTVDDEEIATGKAYPLLPLTSIGRSPTNTIPIEDTFASGEHALIAMRAGVWWLEDRRSRNGTLLNGMDVTEPVIVTDGDILGIGSLKFRIELE
ncbi:MAG: FHA domain-containing protein [Anaerolineae bacterium]